MSHVLPVAFGPFGMHGPSNSSQTNVPKPTLARRVPQLALLRPLQTCVPSNSLPHRLGPTTKQVVTQTSRYRFTATYTA
eukprot:scaffold114697_cov34-Tisochrysis_lutea.AAC.1